MLRPLACALLALLVFGLSPTRASAQDEVRWRLGRSDFLKYERTQTKIVKGKEKTTGTKIVSVHGHDLRDAAQYSPASPLHTDLSQMLALRIPAPGAKNTPVKFDWKPRDGGSIRVKGTVGVTDFGKRIIKIEGTYTFKSRGRASRKDKYWINDGKARSELEFDLAEGVVRTARIELSYEREDMQKSGPGAVLQRDQVFTLRLQAIERRTPADFQKRIDKAIADGVAHLKSKQLEDGTWKPHGNYRVGTTALAILTLVACGVSRDDEKLRRALDWMFTQEPTKTYEQATCLMAVDRAYMPEEEVEALLSGQPIHHYKRNLPPKRMAWVRRVAEALERNASGAGGSWGYPANGRSTLKFDNSNTQYAVLGLRAAGHMGHQVNERTWLGVIRHCAMVQERKGPKAKVSLVRHGTAIPSEADAHKVNLAGAPKIAGFRYSTLEGHDHVASSMTCAGITMLLIARHELRRRKSKALDKKLEKEVAAMLLGGWGWLDRHWAMDRNPMHPTHNWYWYYLYSLERAAVLDSIKRVGGKDWYFEGVMQLLHRQGEKGAWNDPGGDATAPTCFALLFLKRGTSPLGGPVTGDK